MAQFPPLTYPTDFNPYEHYSPNDDPRFKGDAMVVVNKEVKLYVDSVVLIKRETKEKKRLSRSYGMPYLKDVQGLDLLDVNLPDVILNLQKGDRFYLGVQVPPKNPFAGDYYAMTIRSIDDKKYYVEIKGYILKEDVDVEGRPDLYSENLVNIDPENGPSYQKDLDLSMKYNYNPMFSNARLEEQEKNEKRPKSIRNYHNKKKELSANLRLPNRIKTRKTFGGRKRISRKSRKTNKKRRNYK